MSAVVVALAASATLNVVLAATVWAAADSHVRCYRYAAGKAESLPLADPAGCAYSDMATVIALDGRVATGAEGDEP